MGKKYMFIIFSFASHFAHTLTAHRAASAQIRLFHLKFCVRMHGVCRIAVLLQFECNERVNEFYCFMIMTKF